MYELIKHTDEMNRQLARYGVRFGIYKNKEFHEQLFPFDVIPRVITADEFDYLEKGLIQRVSALNAFLNDIYSEKRIIKDGVIPEDFIYTSSGYLPQCEGIVPPGGIFSHISGIDLVQGKDEEWYVLEDNLRIPSGASYPLIARSLTRRVCPEVFRENKIRDNRNYAELLRKTMEYVNVGGIRVILTPGRYNAAFFEHSYLAEKTESVLAMPQDLYVDKNVVYYRSYDGNSKRIGVIYRRISDEYLDPLTFLEESLIGVPHLIDAYRAGNVAIINAPGNGVADDKGIYYFVPKIIEYYFNERPVLKNAPTYLPIYENDRKYILGNIKNLVIKDVAEAGGYGVIFGRDLDEIKLQEMKQLIVKQARRFIAQEVIDFKDLLIVDQNEKVERKADLRAFVLSGETVQVWASGLTRFSRNSESFIVNSSQGGGFKDTWVLSR